MRKAGRSYSIRLLAAFACLLAVMLANPDVASAQSSGGAPDALRGVGEDQYGPTWDGPPAATENECGPGDDGYNPQTGDCEEPSLEDSAEDAADASEGALDALGETDGSEPSGEENVEPLVPAAGEQVPDSGGDSYAVPAEVAPEESSGTALETAADGEGSLQGGSTSREEPVVEEPVVEEPVVEEPSGANPAREVPIVSETTREELREPDTTDSPGDEDHGSRESEDAIGKERDDGSEEGAGDSSGGSGEAEPSRGSAEEGGDREPEDADRAVGGDGVDGEDPSEDESRGVEPERGEIRQDAETGDEAAVEGRTERTSGADEETSDDPGGGTEPPRGTTAVADKPAEEGSYGTLIALAGGTAVVLGIAALGPLLRHLG